MISVLIVGAGNVASHLLRVFSDIDTLTVSQIGSRNLTNVPLANITILAVSDDAIATISAQISNPFVVHTSGSAALTDLQNKTQKGVFYPLQTFSKHKEIDFSQIPFCLEATNTTDLQTLTNLAKLIGNKVYHINSAQRKALHVAAVFVNNFTNHLFKIASDVCEKNQIPFEILHALIEETSNKVKVLPPAKAQTGPAIRNDEKTIKNHLNLLDKKQQEIYKILTKSIQNDS